MPDLKKITLDSVEYEAEAPVLTALNSAQNRCDELEKEGENLQGKLDSANAELEKAKSIDVKSLVKNRVALVEVAKNNLDDETIKNLDEMDDLEIKKAVIKAVQPKANLDEKSEDYIDARFDSVQEMEKPAEKETFKEPENTEKKLDSRDEMIKRQENAWKGDN